MHSKYQRRYPYRKGSSFFNHASDQPESFWFGLVPSLLSTWWKRRAYSANHEREWCAPSTPPICSIAPIITWIGHASFLLQLGGINILIDPVFNDISWFFPRLMRPGISNCNLPQIDLVLLSHNHPDHMDSRSLGQLRDLPGVQFLVPQGDKRWFDKRRFTGVSQYSWWESYRHGDSAENQEVTCTFLPAMHWSQRGIFDKNKSLWGGWIITWQDYTIYFAGDTAYGDHFASIAQEYPNITTALMPIGPCEPHNWMRRTHMNAEQAGQAFIDLGADNFVPMHWGTFAFGYDQAHIPIERLQKWWHAHQGILGDKRLHVVKAGQQIRV